MANLTTIDGGSTNPASGVGGAAPVALQDKLARCQRQLGDWEACPSSKTPEGKKIIENLRAQIGNIESRIQSQPTQRTADTAAAASTSATPPSQAIQRLQPRPPSLSTVGSLLNVFA